MNYKTETAATACHAGIVDNEPCKCGNLENIVENGDNCYMANNLYVLTKQCIAGTTLKDGETCQCGSSVSNTCDVKGQICNYNNCECPKDTYLMSNLGILTECAPCDLQCKGCSQISGDCIDC